MLPGHDEVTRYFAGRLPAILTVWSEEGPGQLIFERDNDGEIVATVPFQPSPDSGEFRIEAALNDPWSQGIKYCRVNDVYRISIRNSSDMYGVIRCCWNHLNWLDFDRIKTAYSDTKSISNLDTNP